MKPSSARIRTPRGYVQLILPSFFERSRLTESCKAMKLLRLYPRLNEPARGKLDSFFQEWDLELKDELARSTAEQEAARRRCASFGSARSQKMTRFHREKIKLAKRAEASLERCGKIRKAYAAAQKKQ